MHQGDAVCQMVLPPFAEGSRGTSAQLTGGTHRHFVPATSVSAAALYLVRQFDVTVSVQIEPLETMPRWLWNMRYQLFLEGVTALVLHLLAQLGDRPGVLQHAALAAHVLLVELLGEVPDQRGIQIGRAGAGGCRKRAKTYLNPAHGRAKSCSFQSAQAA